MYLNKTYPFGLITICGPTAAGKSGLALALAIRLNSVILSADSRQVYREFDIGTAKPLVTEQQLVPHYLIDICDPTETLTVADYQQQAQALISQFHQSYSPHLTPVARQFDASFRERGNPPTGKQSPTEEPLLQEGFPPQASGVGNPPSGLSHRTRLAPRAGEPPQLVRSPSWLGEPDYTSVRWCRG